MKQILALVLLVAVLSACAAAPTAISAPTTAPATSVATARPTSPPAAAAVPTAMAMPSPAAAATAPAAAPTAATTRAAGATAGPTVVISMLNFAFVPDKGVITVAPGTTVMWRNDDDAPHTVTADDKSYNSGDMLKGATFSHTFTTPGEYPYYCIWHGEPGGKGMSGKIIVSGQATGKSSSLPTSPNSQGNSGNYDEETSIYRIDK